MADMLPPLGDARYQGVIVHESDGTIDFDRLREAGFSIVYLRATSGADYVDCRLQANEQAAFAAGLEVGYYHYLTARTISEAQAQANFFLSTLSNRQSLLRPAMQYERHRGLDALTTNAIAQTFLGAVANALDTAPMIRTDATSANLVWAPGLARQYPLWVIDPDVSAPQVGGTNTDAAPDVAEGKWAGWTGWEYAEREDVYGSVQLPLTLFTTNVYTSGAPVGTKLICVNVVYGDTLTSIANLFGTTVNEIVRLNDIANPNRIYPGQTLYIRVPTSTPLDCCDSYTVRRGDTLTSIAGRFGTTVAQLATINKLSNPNRIYVGQVLKLGLCNE